MRVFFYALLFVLIAVGLPTALLNFDLGAIGPLQSMFIQYAALAAIGGSIVGLTRQSTRPVRWGGGLSGISFVIWPRWMIMDLATFSNVLFLVADVTCRAIALFLLGWLVGKLFEARPVEQSVGRMVIQRSTQTIIGLIAIAVIVAIPIALWQDVWPDAKTTLTSYPASLR